MYHWEFNLDYKSFISCMALIGHQGLWVLGFGGGFTKSFYGAFWAMVEWLNESSRDNRKGLRNSTFFCTGKSSMKPYWNCSSGMMLPFGGSSCCKCSNGRGGGVNGAATGAWRGQAWLSSSTKLSTAGDEPLGTEGSKISQCGNSAKGSFSPSEGTWYGILESKVLNVHHISRKSYERLLER